MTGWDFACPDWEERLADGRTPIAELPLDHKAAEAAVAIFDYLHLPDVPGQPPLEEAAGDWIRDVVRAIFGSVEPKTGKRRVGEVFVLVPKKNSKTTSAAAIALTFMLLNQRPKADMLIVGPTQKIAELAYEQAKGMIDADPPDEDGERWLKNRLHARDHLKLIEDRHNGSKLMIRTFDNQVLTGCKPIFCLVDETHELGTVPYAPNVFTQIRGGFVPFPEALMVQITTQSDRPPTGIFKSELDYARGVRDGRITDRVRTLPVIYEFPEAVQTGEEQAWRDPATWHQVTPNLGRSIDLDTLIDGYERSRQDGMTDLIRWATQHLNVEVGLALHANRWRGADHWLAAGDDEVTLEFILATSEVCTVGIDGGGLDDLFGLAVLGRHRRTKAWQHWGHAWAHPEVLVQRKEIAGRLRELEALGQLTVCDRPTQDIEEVATHVERIALAGLLPEKFGVGLDPYGVAALIDELSARGIDDEQMSAVRQGSALSPAVWGLERKLKDGTFLHGAQELMTWVIGNAVAEQRGNAILITKETAGKAKIDPLIALFNAAMLMQRNPAAASAFDAAAAVA